MQSKYLCEIMWNVNKDTTDTTIESCTCHHPPHNISPLKLTYPVKIGHRNRKFIFQPSIFRLFQGGYISLKFHLPSKALSLCRSSSSRRRSRRNLPPRLRRPGSWEARPGVNDAQWPVSQLTINWWFGARWFGILGIPLSNNPFHKGILGIQTTNPNQQLTIS